MKKHFLFILFIWFCVASNASSDPQLRKYHQISLLPHSGQVDLYMDLQELSDPDFDVKIGLQYISDGFRPLSYSGSVGDNWSLIATGQITREIIGVADDGYVYHTSQTSMGSQPHIERLEKGLLVLLRDSSYSLESNESMYNGNWDDSDEWSDVKRNSNTQHLDVESDIYTFNFHSHHGKFMIGLDGEVEILSGDYVSVDISSMPIQEKAEPFYQSQLSNFPMVSSPLLSQITIKTLDGYTYIFGGTFEALSYSLPFDRYIQTPDITTWMLNRIIAPNGREMRYHYKPMMESDTLKHFTYHASVIVDIDDTASDYFLADTMYINPFVNTDQSLFYTRVGGCHLEKQPLLDSITTSDNSFKVVFAYQSLPNSVYSSDYYSIGSDNIYWKYWSSDKYFLKNVTVYNATQLLSDWELTYNTPTLSPSTPNYRRQYLSLVRHTLSNLRYQFTYDFTNAHSLTNINNLDSVDMSGYLISNPKLGTLTSFCDPFGKRTQLEYTLCRYDSIRLIKQKGTEYISVTRSVSHRNKIINTVAVSSIEAYDNRGSLLFRKKYSYGDFPDNIQPLSFDIPNTGGQVSDKIGESSGILNIDFAMDISDVANQSWNEGKRYLITPYISPNGSMNTKIEYSKVKEFEYRLNSNSILYQNILFYDRTDDVIIATPNCRHNLLRAYSYVSQSNRRQSLVAKEEYVGTELSSQHIYTYEPIVVNPGTSQQTQWNVGRNGTCAYKTFIPQSHPSEERAIVYEPSGNYEIQTTYTRDKKHRVIQETISQNERTQFVRYTYPDQLFEDKPSYRSFYAMGYKGLVNRNEINKPIEMIKGFIRDGHSYITSGALQLYQAYNWSGIGYEEFEPPIDMPDIPIIRSNSLLNQPEYYAPIASFSLGIDTPIPLNEFSSIRIEDNNVVFDQHYDTIATYRYNKYLRKTKQTIAGITTNYVWDDNKICITKQTVGSQTTQYTHIPYVGVSSVTSPQGITTYYNYDALGNVIEIYQMHNNKKVILQSILFHYQSQQ